MILAYAVALQKEVELPERIKVFRYGELQCFYAERDRAPDAQNLKEEAIRFFEVNRVLFAQMDILEFRFPTLLNDQAELEEHLARIARDIKEDLQRLRGCAQLTVYVSPTHTGHKARTGTEYLKGKIDAMKLRDRLVEELSQVTEAREARVDGDRVHLLLDRDVVQKAKAAVLERGFSSAGPFPPSSFSKLLS